MARLVLTNTPRTLSAVLRGWGEAGLSEGFRRADGPLGAATATKRAIEHRNAFAPAPDRWILGTGTYVTYSGRAGEGALREILDAFEPDDPLAVRGRLFGHYALAVRTGDRVAVFCDAAASYELYRWTDPGGGGAFVVSSFLSDFLHQEGVPGAVDDLRALRAAYHGERGIGRESVLAGVCGVRGDEVVEIALGPGGATAEVRRVPPPRRPAAAGGFEDALRGYLRESGRIYEALSAFPSVGIACTGGLDSRLLVAGARRHGLRPRLLYGAGDSMMTNTRAEDLAVARAIAEAYGWPLDVLDWRQGRPHDAAERRRLHRRYGFKQPYGATAGLLRALEGGMEPYPVLQMGGYNPAFTNRRPWGWGGETIAMNEFLRRYTADYDDVFTSREARDAHLRGLEIDVRQLACAQGIAVEDGRIAREDYVRLLIHGRVSKAAFNLNGFNQFSYYLAPYFTTELYAALLAVPAEWRAGDRFQIRAIAASCDRALEFPIFSGLKPFRLDPGTSTMSPVEPGAAERVRRRIGAAAARLRPAGGDATPAFREGLRRAMEREHPSARIDARRFARKDLRAVHRYLTALELPDALSRTA